MNTRDLNKVPCKIDADLLLIIREMESMDDDQLKNLNVMFMDGSLGRVRANIVSVTRSAINKMVNQK